MVYPILIAGISLTAVCVLFYIYTRYRRRISPAKAQAHFGRKRVEKGGYMGDSVRVAQSPKLVARVEGETTGKRKAGSESNWWERLSLAIPMHAVLRSSRFIE
jgi:hypothetical protein